MLESQVPTIVTLTKGCTSAKVVRDAESIPAGCGSALVTSTIVVHTLVRVRSLFFQYKPKLHVIQGNVDLDVEIAKCEKKLAIAQMSLQKITKLESQSDYAATVPENVRTANDEKVGLSLFCLINSLPE